jgi:hypothetical protein
VVDGSTATVAAVEVPAKDKAIKVAVAICHRIVADLIPFSGLGAAGRVSDTGRRYSREAFPQ